VDQPPTGLSVATGAPPGPRRPSSGGGGRWRAGGCAAGRGAGRWVRRPAPTRVTRQGGCHGGGAVGGESVGGDGGGAVTADAAMPRARRTPRWMRRVAPAARCPRADVGG